MKLYHAYKKQLNKTRQDLVLVQGLALVVLLFFPFFFSSAQTVTDIQNKISQKDSDIQKLEQEIAQYQSQLNDLGKQKDSLNGTIKQLDLTAKKLNADISVTQNKIDKTNLKIQEFGKEFLPPMIVEKKDECQF